MITLFAVMGAVLLVCAALAAGAVLGGTKTPAPEAVPPRVPAHAPAPGQPPSPGAHGRQVPRPAPAPGHACGPVTGGIGFNDEGCLHFWDPLTGTWVVRRHTRHLQFDEHAWEAKLGDCGPRDGESLAEWNRRIES